MPFIPPEILPQLNDLGIQDASESLWRRLESHPEAFTFTSVSCGYIDPPVILETTLTWLAGRRIYIGQCPRCKAIYTRDAIPAGVAIE